MGQVAGKQTVWIKTPEQ